MMTQTRLVPRLLIFGGLLVISPSAYAADLIETIDDAYSHKRLAHTTLARDAECALPIEDRRFLEDLFNWTDEIVLLNTNVSRWFESDGRRGLHAADYLERHEAFVERLRRLDLRDRGETIRRHLTRSMGLQRAFVEDWLAAIENDTPFASQLTDEYAYQEGLHGSERLLVKTYAELRAIFPDACDTIKRSMRVHLRAMAF